jgi:hypothetical protein
MKETTNPAPPESSPILIGGAVQLTFDGVVLAPNDLSGDCSCAAGSTTVTMSYANAPLGGQNPQALTVWQYLGPEIGWIDLRDYQPPGTSIQVDSETKTVTAFSPFAGGIFSIGVTGGGGSSGGGGGGIGLPGAGIVLDLLAPVTAESTPPPPTTTPPSNTDQSSNPSGASTVTDNSNSTISSPTGQTNGPTTQSNGNASGQTATSGSTILQQSSSFPSDKGSAFNTTIPVPGIGNVILSFSNLGTERTFVVSVLKSPSALSALKITKTDNGKHEALFTLNNTKYDIVGPVLNISPADLKLNGAVTVTVPYNSTMVPAAGDNVRLLEYTGSAWEDVTTKPPADGKVVTGSLNTLGPLVAAVKAQ